MQKAVSLLIILVILSSCAAKKKVPNTREAAQRNNERIRKENQKAITAYSSYTVLSYIERFKPIAIQEMNLYGIPASITLAQGMFESGFGNGELARVANNHFGIKCTSDWKGQSYFKNDDKPDDCFRVYKTPEESYRDHSDFLI
jgi:flagellum-specific peptidoglycan hydrolase FlgJ